MIADRLRLIQAVSGGGGGGSFDPSQLSGMLLWLKADTGVTLDGSGNVETWADQSGNSNDAYQTDAAKRPTVSSSYAVNGVPAVLGTGSQLLNLTTIYGGTFATKPVTVIWIGTKTNTTSGVTLLEAFSSNGGFSFGGNSTTFFAFLSNVAVVNYGPAKGMTQPAAHFARSNHPTFSVESTQGSNVTQSITSTLYAFNIKKLFLGDNTSTNPGYAINEVFIYNRAISDAELAQVKDYIATRYNLKTTASLILNMDGTPGSTTFVDSSPNALAVTANGDAQIVSDATFGTVASFDGSGDYLTIPNSLFTNLPGDFTIECWFYGTGISSTTGTIIGKWGGGAVAWTVLVSTSAVQFGIGNSGSFVAAPTFATTIANNQWYHVAITRSGSSIKCFLNGLQIGSTLTYSSNLSSTSTTDLGYLKSANGNYFNGRIGPLRVTKGVALYTSNFTPPTGPFPTS